MNTLRLELTQQIWEREETNRWWRGEKKRNGRRIGGKENERAYTRLPNVVKLNELGQFFDTRTST